MTKRSLGIYIALCSVHVSTSIEDTNQKNLFCDDGICTRMSNEPLPETVYGVDEHKNCKDWALAGECGANPKYMLLSCAKSCRAYLAPKECFDKENTDRCQSLAELGQCLLDRDHMEEACKETCMFCIGDDLVLRSNGISKEEIVRRNSYISIDLGENQENIGRDKVERYNNREQIQAMDKYSKQDLTAPSFTPEARSLCTNKKKECCYYASKGMCKSKPIFMMNNCPLACMMCEELERFHHCVGTRHPFNNPLFVPMDTIDYIANADEIGLSTIGAMFDSLNDNSEKAQIITQPPIKEGSDGKNDPYIALIEDFLSPEECQEIISLINKEEGWKPSPVHKPDHFSGTHEHKLPIRSSSTFECDNSDETGCIDISSSLIEKLSKWIDKPVRHFEPVEITRYSPGGFYTLHEEFKIHDEWKPSGPRVLSIFIILSEAAGGSFGFPSLDMLLVKPKRGSVLIWSNMNDSMTYDPSLKYEIMPVRGGDLFMLSTHVHQFDYLDSVEQGCA